MRVKLEQVCSRGSSNLMQKEIAELTGAYPIFGAAGQIGTADFYHQGQPYVAVVKDGAGIGRTMLLPAFSSVIGTLQYLIPNEKVLPDYLCYVVQHMKLAKYFSGATIPHIYFRDYKNEEFNLESLDRQREIVSILNRIQRIIAHRRTQLAKLDELVKCRFVELFGDPILNEKKWITKPVKELTTKVGSGATPKGGDSSYKDSGISLIRSLNVHNNIFKTKELAHIDNEQANQLSNVTIQSGDVLLNITGASVARCCIVPDDILPARVNQHVCIIRCNDMLNPLFLERLLTSDNYQTYLWNVAEGGGGTRQALTKQQIENVSIITPPITLQATFATFVSRIDKLRFVEQIRRSMHYMVQIR